MTMQEKWNFLSSHASFRITVNGTLTIRSSYLLSNLGQWKKTQLALAGRVIEEKKTFPRAVLRTGDSVLRHNGLKSILK